MSYVFSFLARSPPSGFALLIILNILVGKKEKYKERKKETNKQRNKEEKQLLRKRK